MEIRSNWERATASEGECYVLASVCVRPNGCSRLPKRAFALARITICAYANDCSRRRK